MEKFCKMPQEITNKVTVAAAIINNRGQVLIVKGLRDNAWWLPTTDLLQEEDEQKGIERLISQQLPGTRIKINSIIHPFVYERENILGFYKAFVCSAEGDVYPPSGESINMTEFVDYNTSRRYNILEMSKKAISQFVQQGIILS